MELLVLVPKRSPNCKISVLGSFKGPNCQIGLFRVPKGSFWTVPLLWGRRTVPCCGGARPLVKGIIMDRPAGTPDTWQWTRQRIFIQYWHFGRPKLIYSKLLVVWACAQRSPKASWKWCSLCSLCWKWWKWSLLALAGRPGIIRWKWSLASLLE